MTSNNELIIVFTGVSGAGKTTLMEGLKESFQGQEEAKFYHFDSIGVPSLELMEKDYGSAKEWQRKMTYAWIDRLVNELSGNPLIFFEGQTEIKFITEAFEKMSFKNYKIFLVHAKNEDRHQRLRNMRNQPELVNADMDNWANFLMKQAQLFETGVIDTTLHTIDEIVSSISDWWHKETCNSQSDPKCVNHTYK